MILIACRPVALVGAVLLTLPACAASPPVIPAAPAAVDLGPSTRVPRILVALTGTAPGLNGQTIKAPAGNVQPVHDGANDAHATGTVNAVDPAQHKINLSHTPIPSIGWPAMTMDFPVAPSVDLSHVRPGSRVDFSIQKGKNGMYEVQSIQPAGAGR